MVSRSFSHACWVSVLLAVTTGAATAQRSRYDPGAGNESKPREGFADFALKQVNPTEKDYGECIAEGRQMLVQETVQNSLFWSNLAAVGMLSLSVLIILYQWKEWQRRELIAATGMAQLCNALESAKRQAGEAFQRHSALIKTRNTDAEKQLREAGPRKEGPANSAQSRPALQDASTLNPAPLSGTSSHPMPARHSEAMPSSANKPPHSSRNVAPDGDLVAKVNNLQHQLTVAQEQVRTGQEREQNLRQKLSRYEGKSGEERG